MIPLYPPRMNESDEPIDEPNSPENEKPRLIQLSFEETRVLGCLMEKEMTTPEYYPLTLNALVAACNQSSNREPVVEFASDTVQEAMEGLRYKGLGILVHQAGARVPKNKHTLDAKFPYLTEGERALLCVLFLRGQQTLGELRQRSERLHAFADLDSTQAALDRLIAHEPFSLVKLFPAGGGRRVPTFAHLFCGEPEDSHHAMAAAAPHAASETVVAGPTWREAMEKEMAGLREEITSLRDEVRALKEALGG